MKVLELNAEEGYLRIRTEVPEDLYFLALLVDPGDELRGWTFRQVRISTVTGEERGERVRVKIAINVKKVEFQRFSRKLRVLGVVKEAPEDLHIKGLHHTITIDVGDEVELSKPRFSRHHQRILELASMGVKTIPVISVGDEVVVGFLRPQGMEIVSLGRLPHVRKEGSIASQLNEPIKRMLESSKSYFAGGAWKQIVVLAPSPLMEAVTRVADEVFGEQRGKVLFIKVSEGGLAGIYEFLRESESRELLEGTYLGRAKEAVAELLKLLERDSKMVALGYEEVRRAAGIGAVKAVIVVDEALLGDEKKHVLALLDEAMRTARDLIVLPSDLEEARLVTNLGGIAAILYYPVVAGGSEASPS